MSGHIQDRWTSPDPTNAKKRIKNSRYGSGLRWIAVWVEPDGTRKRKSFEYKDQAKAFIETQNVHKQSDDYVSYESGSITIAELAPKWLETKRKIRDSTVVENEGRLALHILPRWGHYMVREIAHEEVEEWISSIDLGAASIRKIHGALAGILDYAIKTKRLAKNPAREIELEEEPEPEKRYLTHQEADLLVSFMPQHWRDFTNFMFDVGLRMGEGAELRVKDFDRKRRRVHVSRSAGRVRGVWVVGPTKNGKPRDAPLTTQAFDILARHSKGKRRNDLIFSAPRGGQIERTNYRRIFVKAAARANQIGLSPHDMRHTAASWAIAAGANPLHVQQMLGHKSAAETLDTYAGLFDKNVDEVVRLMDALRLRASQEPPIVLETA